MTQSRRSFLKNAAFLPSALYLTQCKTVGRTGAPGSALKYGPVDSYIPKRVSWDELPEADKKAFIDAIAKMKTTMVEVPGTFGEGGARQLDLWTAQAEVHQWYCPHGTRDFLPWHRAYLYHFELILRRFTNNDKFRLPYWDWSKSQVVPEGLMTTSYLDGLGVETKDRKKTIELAVDLVKKPKGPKMGDPRTRVWWENALSVISSETTFEGIGGDVNSNGGIEHPYHNMVHTGVGGSMSYVEFAARDPIFWLHHCNVDRLWSAWTDARITAVTDQPAAADEKTKAELIKAGIDTLFPNDDDIKSWLDQIFDNQFWTPDLTLSSISLRSSLLTEALGYNYPGIKNTWTVSDIESRQNKSETPAPVEAVTPAPQSLRLADPTLSALSLQFTLPAAVYGQQLSSVRLKLGGIPVPTDTTQIYEVQLIVAGKTLPLDAIAFFGASHKGHKNTLIGVSLNDHLEALKALPEGKRTVQLVLILKDAQGNTLPIPSLNTNPSAYQIKVKAVFK